MTTWDEVLESPDEAPAKAPFGRMAMDPTKLMGVVESAAALPQTLFGMATGLYGAIERGVKGSKLPSQMTDQETAERFTLAPTVMMPGQVGRMAFGSRLPAEGVELGALGSRPSKTRQLFEKGDYPISGDWGGPHQRQAFIDLVQRSPADRPHKDIINQFRTGRQLGVDDAILRNLISKVRARVNPKPPPKAPSKELKAAFDSPAVEDLIVQEYLAGTPVQKIAPKLRNVLGAHSEDAAVTRMITEKLHQLGARSRGGSETYAAGMGPGMQALAAEPIEYFPEVEPDPGRFAKAAITPSMDARLVGSTQGLHEEMARSRRDAEAFVDRIDTPREYSKAEWDAVVERAGAD